MLHSFLCPYSVSSRISQHGMSACMLMPLLSAPLFCQFQNRLNMDCHHAQESHDITPGISFCEIMQISYYEPTDLYTLLWSIEFFFTCSHFLVMQFSRPLASIEQYIYIGGDPLPPGDFSKKKCSHFLVMLSFYLKLTWIFFVVLLEEIFTCSAFVAGI